MLILDWIYVFALSGNDVALGQVVEAAIFQHECDANDYLLASATV